LVVDHEDGAHPPVPHRPRGGTDRLVVVDPDGARRHHITHLGVHDVLSPGRGSVNPVPLALPTGTGPKQESAWRRNSRVTSETCGSGAAEEAVERAADLVGQGGV